MPIIDDLSLSGEMVEPLDDKSFKIIGIPSYADVKIGNNDQQRKLIMKVKLMANEVIFDYYPNQASKKKLVTYFGINTDNWDGQVAEFEVVTQKVMGQSKKVLYIK